MTKQVAPPRDLLRSAAPWVAGWVVVVLYGLLVPTSELPFWFSATVALIWGGFVALLVRYGLRRLGGDS